MSAFALLSGCYDAHVCGGPEQCNLIDDDCDGLVDEDFIDQNGVYSTSAHCGACGVDCQAVFPTASEVACDLGALSEAVLPLCQIVSCPEDTRQIDGACVPLTPAQCLGCATDADCDLRESGSVCRTGDRDQRFCVSPCDTECGEGFVCQSGFCLPLTGECACTVDTLGAEFACTLAAPSGDHFCAGIALCDLGGLSACEPALTEACNAADDNCDGQVDEDFLRDGFYLHPLHCGECGSPCAPQGPNVLATCDLVAGAPTCVSVCEEGFVDVDGIAANGCECERWDGEGPPPGVGGDLDCDGVVNVTDDFVYVTPSGSDTNPGTLEFPKRTIQGAANTASLENKDVLVATGIYEGPVDMVAGVSIFGGYRPDFRDRDLELFPVLLVRTVGEPGLPVLRCTNVNTPTVIDGLSVEARDAVAPGAGSTAVLITDCTDAVRLSNLTVEAGRGADGLRGTDSSGRLIEWGLMSLSDLDGRDAGDGFPGTADGVCTLIGGGSPGLQSCQSGPVSGGAGGAATCPDAICQNGQPCANAGCTDFTVGGVCDFEQVLALATPNPSAGAGSGPFAGAPGELTYNAPTNRDVCNFCDDNPTLRREGAPGGDGSRGADGLGGTRQGVLFAIDGDGRARAADGGPGTVGQDGSGGGGGSAGSGYEVIGNTEGTCSDRAGGSGGGGGSGGCGAPGATGGSGGGVSAGIVVRMSNGGLGPRVQEVRVITASGGRGGDGGIGAQGGTGGRGGNGGPARFFCARSGGRGGEGGAGGAGGGGAGGGGGSTIGFLVQGASAEYRDVIEQGAQVERTGTPGPAGRGGFSEGGLGEDGLEGASLDFSF